MRYLVDGLLHFEEAILNHIGLEVSMGSVSIVQPFCSLPMATSKGVAIFFEGIICFTTEYC